MTWEQGRPGSQYMGHPGLVILYYCALFTHPNKIIFGCNILLSIDVLWPIIMTFVDVLWFGIN